MWVNKQMNAFKRLCSRPGLEECSSRPTRGVVHSRSFTRGEQRFFGCVNRKRHNRRRPFFIHSLFIHSRDTLTKEEEAFGWCRRLCSRANKCFGAKPTPRWLLRRETLCCGRRLRRLRRRCREPPASSYPTGGCWTSPFLPSGNIIVIFIIIVIHFFIYL